MNQKNKKLEGIVYFLNLYFGMIFFVVYGILGLTYSGSSGDRTFIYGYMILDVLVLIYFAFNTFRYGLGEKGIIMLLIALFFLAVYYIAPPYSEDGIQDGRIFLAESLPAIMIAIILAKTNRLNMISRYYDVLNIVLTIGLLLNFRMFTSGAIGGLAGTTNYQALSYTAAFAFSINVFGLFAGNFYPERFTVFRSSAFYVVELIFLPIQMLACIMSGGRGGAILIILSFIVVLYYANKWKKKKSRTIFTVLGIAAFGLLALSFLPEQYSDPIFNGLNRQFSYISNGGIDMGETSDRDITYGDALDAFYESPAFGYGIYKYADKLGFYPHNIFLQVMVQGGVFYLIIFVTFITVLFVKALRMLKDSTNSLLIIIALYPFVLLLFSGSYTRDPLFWFLVTYLFVVNYTPKSKLIA